MSIENYLEEQLRVVEPMWHALHAHYEGQPIPMELPVNGYIFDEEESGMNKIKVNRKSLLEKVKLNRTSHRTTFEEALTGYREQAIKELEASLAEAKAGKRIKRGLALVEPMDMTREYDRVIVMLEMSVEDELEITQQEVMQYVMDDWAWKHQFETVSAMYNNKAG